MNINKIQGFANGGQLRNAFLEYNKFAGSDVVDMSRTYNTGDSYNNRIIDGGQIALAFKEISKHSGVNLVTGNNFSCTNGSQLKEAVTKLNAIITTVTPVIIPPIVIPPTAVSSAPVYQSSVIGSGGFKTELDITYDVNVTLVEDGPGFTVLVNGVDSPVDAVSFFEKGVSLDLLHPAKTGDVVLLSYDAAIGSVANLVTSDKAVNLTSVPVANVI